MFEKIKENIGGIIVVCAILGIATCNVILNTTNEKNIFTNPKAGDYYVFKGLLTEGNEQICKIKEVKTDSIVFYLPHGELALGFKQNKSEPAIRDADKKGDMYGDETMGISKADIAVMKENDGLSKRLSGAKGRLEFVFR